MDLYAENILDHYRHPRGKKSVSSPTVTHEETNVSCGDALTLSLVIEGGLLSDLGWEGTGCAISQAGMSMLAEELSGKTLAEIDRLKVQDIRDFLGVPIGTRRMKCAFLCLHTLKNALRKFRGQEMQGWMETVGEG